MRKLDEASRIGRPKLGTYPSVETCKILDHSDSEAAQQANTKAIAVSQHVRTRVIQTHGTSELRIAGPAEKVY